MYLACEIRPDIVFVVGQLSKYNADPRKSHLQATKSIVRDLKGTMQMGLVFRKEVNSHLPKKPLSYGLIGYADSNIAGDPADRKLVLGYCFSLNKAVVS